MRIYTVSSSSCSIDFKCDISSDHTYGGPDDGSYCAALFFIIFIGDFSFIVFSSSGEAAALNAILGFGIVDYVLIIEERTLLSAREKPPFGTSVIAFLILTS